MDTLLHSNFRAIQQQAHGHLSQRHSALCSTVSPDKCFSQRSRARSLPLIGRLLQRRRCGGGHCCIPAAQSGGLSYKDAGVDIDAGNELVRRIKKLNPAIGGFSGAYEYGDSYLVAGTDGVGTKLKLAFELNRHDTIGIDLVAMSVNDIITSGARPMFFLDYFATGALDVDIAEAVVKGIVAGCQESDCILMGGETAEMPGMYQGGEYDLAGFAVGTVKKDALIDGSGIKAGDVVLGLASSGVHSNGFSLVRKILQVSGTNLSDQVPWGGATFGDVLLAPTALYVRPIMKLLQHASVKGLIHMTGGGFPENIPRVVPGGLQTRINRSAWDIPPLFKWLQQAGGVSNDEMFRTFNMGVGMVIVVSAEEVDRVLSAGIGAFHLGNIAPGDGVQLVD